MKRPSLQFYPGDWLANSNLRRCTFEERGVWISVICLLHDQEDYGLIRWPLADIAQAVGSTVDCLHSLVRKGVLKGSDEYLEAPFVYIPRSARQDGEPVTLVPEQAGPVWYSSRMVKDEHIRQNRGAATRFGTDGERQAQALKTKPSPKPSPKPPFGDDIGAHPTFTQVSGCNGDAGSSHAVHPSEKAHLLNIEAETSPKPPFGEGLGVVKGDGSSSSSSSSNKKYTPLPPQGDEPAGFEEFWARYPRKAAKKGARKAFAKLRADGQLLSTMLMALSSQSQSAEWLKDGGQFIPYPATWINGRRWEDAQPAGITAGVDNTRPAWALSAGFANRFEAESSGCTERNASQYRDGRRITTTREHA